ncbi:MAG: PfkB family carbohydrate kinase, partial [Gemmatimonadota bacterium]
MPPTRDRILELLEAAKSRRVVVVGDVMLDRYLIGDTERLSPEAPVPVVAVRENRSALGGAANVAANVRAIGAECTLIGVVGDDANGGEVRTELASHGIADDGLITLAGRPTT